jgi:prephenate dehydrogenase
MADIGQKLEKDHKLLRCDGLAEAGPSGFGPVGIVGLGLIGGSLAKALQRKAGVQVIGLSRNRAVIQAALAEGVLAKGAVLPSLPEEPGKPGCLIDPDSPDFPPVSPDEEVSWHLLATCEVVFVCTPPSTVPAYVKLIARYCPGLLTDVASVKQPIMEQIKLERFIGGHPMAGSERTGYSHSSELMLENAIYVLCLQPDTQLPYTKISRLEQLIRLSGATPLLLGAEEHDKAVAIVSHLPHVAAAALSLLAALQDQGSLSRLAAGGFRDITRIASSDASLWTGISQENARELLPVLDRYLDLLNGFRQALAAGDEQSLQRFFLQAAQYRNALPVDGRGALSAHGSLTVYVPDKPGVLGHVTTLLGEHDINISNIRIRELRTYEGGCLQLLLPDSAQAARAAWVLKEAGYECD